MTPLEGAGVVLVELPEEVVEGKRLGRHVEHDPRSRDYPFMAPQTVPIQNVLWPRLSGPFDQGQIGSCTGNATAGAVNTKPLHGAHPASNKILVEADALKIYEMATHLDSSPGSYPPDDTGSSGLAAAKAAKKLGLIGSYQHAFNLHAALQALMHGPVITGVAWYEGFDNPDSNDEVFISGQVRGGHELEVRGFSLGRSADYSDSLVIAENSWGPNWGNAGMFSFTVATWAQLLAEQGDVTVLVP